MREILFKAKRIDNGEWVKGNLIKTFTGISYIAKEFDHILSTLERYEVDPTTICQYTGLTDKNGRKIWENDILLQKTTELHWCQWENSGVVRYGEYDWNESYIGFVSVGFYVEAIVKKGDINRISCGLSQHHINNTQYPTEVIGNVFDNPELLEDK